MPGRVASVPSGLAPAVDRRRGHLRLVEDEPGRARRSMDRPRLHRHTQHAGSRSRRSARAGRRSDDPPSRQVGWVDQQMGLDLGPRSPVARAPDRRPSRPPPLRRSETSGTAVKWAVAGSKTADRRVLSGVRNSTRPSGNGTTDESAFGFSGSSTIVKVPLVGSYSSAAAGRRVPRKPSPVRSARPSSSRVAAPALDVLGAPVELNVSVAGS